MGELVRADQLAAGDTIELPTGTWLVAAVEGYGKQVEVSLQDAAGNVYPKRVKEKQRFTRVYPVPVNLAKPGNTVTWDEAATSEEPVVAILGAKLIGVEEEGGKLIVPPVTDGTILGHLATMHRVRFDGVSIADAKVWAKRNAPGEDLNRVLLRLDLQEAYRVHDAQHAAFASLVRPHWHSADVRL